MLEQAVEAASEEWGEEVHRFVQLNAVPFSSAEPEEQQQIYELYQASPDPHDALKKSYRSGPPHVAERTVTTACDQLHVDNRMGPTARDHRTWLYRTTSPLDI